jgi:hypothetical protein
VARVGKSNSGGGGGGGGGGKGPDGKGGGGAKPYSKINGLPGAGGMYRPPSSLHASLPWLVSHISLVSPPRAAGPPMAGG